MKDAKGKKLNVGDPVAFIDRWYKTGYTRKGKGTINRFTKKGIYIDCVDEFGYPECFLKFPNNVWLIDKDFNENDVK